MLAFAGETGELPDQDFLKWRVSLRRFVQHLAELRTVGYTPALSFIDEFAYDRVAVSLGIVSERPELGGH